MTRTLSLKMKHNLSRNSLATTKTTCKILSKLSPFAKSFLTNFNTHINRKLWLDGVKCKFVIKSQKNTNQLNLTLDCLKKKKNLNTFCLYINKKIMELLLLECLGSKCATYVASYLFLLSFTLTSHCQFTVAFFVSLCDLIPHILFSFNCL